MRPARSRRVQAQRKFAQGAYVPPSVCAVVVAENRREVTQDARNVTINHMTASSLLDVVSLQSAASSRERLGLHSHLNSQPVVLIERLRGRNQARDVPPPPSPPETVQPLNSKSSIKKPAEPPKLHVSRKRQEYKRVHVMSLRSRRLNKLVLNKAVAQSSAPVKKVPLKRRRRNSSDEDEPLIFQKTRKKSSAAAAESNAKNISTKAKPPKNLDVPRRTTTKENKTNAISSKQMKQSSAKKKTRVKDAPQKRILNDKESTPVPPKEFTVSVVKENLKTETAAQDNLVTQDDSSDIAFAADDPVALDDPVTINKPVVEPAPVANKPVDVGKPDSNNSFPAMFTDESSGTDGALGALDDLPAFGSLLEVSDDEPTECDAPDEEIWNEVVPLVQNNISDQVEDQLTRASTPDDLPTLRYESDEEPMVQDLPAVEQDQEQCEAGLTIQSSQNANPPSVSPEPGPSGTQSQFRINNPDSDQDNDEDDLQSFIKNVFENQVASEVQTSPKNAPTKHIDSHCKGIKTCSRIKILDTQIIRKANSHIPHASQSPSQSQGQDLSTGAPENDLERGHGETEDVEISNENTTVAEDKDDGYLRFNVPSQYELSNVTMKVRESKIYGKSILVVNCEKTGESSKDKQDLSQLEGKEHVLDQLIDTLNISRNVSSESRNVNSARGNLSSESRDINSGRRDLTSESRDVNSEIQIDNPDDRSTAMSATSNTPEQEKSHRIRSEKKKISYQKVVATRRRLAEAKVMQDRIRQEKERDILRIELKKQMESQIMGEKSDNVKNKEQEYARLKLKLMEKLRDEMVDDLRMFDEVDTLAKRIEKEKDVNKCKLAAEDGTLVDAPVYHPSEEEFQDPITFYEKIYEETKTFGICKVVPPPGWKPPSEVNDDLKFDVMNQYISRLFNRWGPAARELSAIKLCLQQQNISFARPPHVDGVEINLPKLYHLVQRLGGLESVINKKRWGKVADDLRIAKGGGNERKLDQIYMKFLLPYDTLSHQERQEIMRKVELAWNKKNQKLLDRAMNPLYRQKRMLDLMDSSDDETEDEDTKAALKHAEDCIVKGQVMVHSRFKKVASTMFESVIGPNSEAAPPPEPEHIEKLYWGIVNSGTDHVCVHTAAVDTGNEGHGFSTKVEPYARHPWNPKRVIDNPRNVLRYLGPVVGVTLPTLLLGMIFSTSCWHKDPHAVAWYEFQSLGPTRIWYGIPEDQADDFRMAVETLSPTSCQNKSLWLSSEITMIPPSVLRDHNVRLSRVTQDKGEFILAFPNAYACSISTGYTKSESVYFAPPTWLDCLWKVFKEARESCEPTMFSMEHLLYNIGRDKKPVLEILEHAQPLYDKILREEVTNRQMLQERGLSLVSELLSAQEGDKQTDQKHQEECDYCRASLFLSKVKGLTAKNSVLCLEHTLTLLDSEKYRETDVKQLQFVVHVTVKELNKVHDDMKRHLRIKT